MVKNISILVSGRVQGVFFRASTKARADELKIRGIVKNIPTGQVYIEAEGEEEALQLFEQWCKVGPQLANVENLEITTGTVKGYQDFAIVR